MTVRLLDDRLPGIAYGGDYNPEQWPEEVWAEDVRLMREACVNLVSLGIFSWSWLQPAEDRFEFGWLDRILDLLHEGGVRVDLATATASPPPWLSRQHPEMLPVLADGQRLWPGARQHYCPSSPVYREAARRLVEALASRYGKHPAVVMWHVNNEYGCHVPACYCEVSAADFRAWLRRRYGSVEALNQAWGTAFWSQRYGDWEEILPPRRTPTWPNPSQQLDFQRFSSDALLACYEVELAVLRRLTPELPVTTNFMGSMGLFKPLDYWRWAAREDIVSYDCYPDPADPEAPVWSALGYDLMRSLGQGRPWLLMEQTASRVNWRPVNVAKAPGQMRLWSYQALARGADGILFFQWRQSRAGAEKFHSAMVPHGSPEASSTWHEVVELGRELKELGKVAGSRVEAEIAIVHDWESWWALELPSKPAQIDHVEQLHRFYRPLYEANRAVDFTPAEADLSRYRLVLAPSLYLVSDAAAENLIRYVRQGGHLLLTFFSGIVDPADQIRLGGYPAPFRELLGLTVEDFKPLATGEPLRVGFGDGQRARADLWSERVLPSGAEVLASFESGQLAGQPALTQNRFGRGLAWYLATRLDPAGTVKVVREMEASAGVPAPVWLPEGIEAVRRTGPSGSFLFLLNHTSEEVAVEAPKRVLLPARGVKVLPWTG